MRFTHYKQFLQLILLSATAFAGLSLTTVTATATDQQDRVLLGGFRNDVHILLYENDSSIEKDPTSSIYFFKERSKIANVHTTVFGGKLKERHHYGFGDKLKLLKPFLEVANSNELIIVADAREVLLNIPENNEETAIEAVDSFIDNFHKLTKNHPNAVVMSAEDQCCAAALSHARPGDYFDSITKKRKHRACSSGRGDDCLWQDNDNITSWKEVMRERALDDYETTTPSSSSSSGHEVEYNNVYLNSGILVGYPKDLMKLLQISDINASEDDQAVLSDLMYTFPEMIQLDYHQEIFGNNQVQKGLQDGCLFEKQQNQATSTDTRNKQPLIHSELMTQPLILHTPQKFYDCLDTLIEGLGGESQKRYLIDYGHGEEGVHRRLVNFADESSSATGRSENDNSNSNGNGNGVTNYGNYGGYWSYGSYGSYGSYDPYGFYRYYGYFRSYYGFFRSYYNGAYGYFNNYGNYGQYGNYGAYGYFNNYGNYGAYRYFNNYGNYGQYGQYGNNGNYNSESSNSESIRGRVTYNNADVDTNADADTDTDADADTDTDGDGDGEGGSIILESRTTTNNKETSDNTATTPTPTPTPTPAPTSVRVVVVDDDYKETQAYSSWYYRVYAKIWPWAN